MELTLGELAERLGATLRGDATVRIRGVAGIREAEAGQITFLANPKYEAYLSDTRASAVILNASGPEVSIPALLSDNPYLTFLGALRLFDPGLSERPSVGVHPSAVVSETATLGIGVAVGPLVVISSGAKVGADSVLMAGAYLGPDVVLGPGCVLYPRVVVRQGTEIGGNVIIHSGAVIGDDGFGFAPDGPEYRKIPQLGRVVIEDEVEIGANATIDRATTGVTRIARGTKIDNLVMIAHNVEVGEHCILCAQTGISGSTRVGRHVTLAGQVGVVGHVTIADEVKVGAQGGVIGSLAPGQSYSGYPAQPHMQAQRNYAALRQLPEALRLLRRLAKQVSELEARLKEGESP